MKKLVVSTFILLSPYISIGQTSILATERPKKNWTTEAQLNTISNSSSATFGPALLYNLNNDNQIGFRFLAPVGVGDTSTLSFMAVYRYYFSESKTNLFSEGTVGTNWYSFGDPRTTINSPSVGTNLGIIHHLTEDISFGGLAGLEWTRIRLEKTFASNEPNSMYIWGRIALFGSLTF